MNENDKLAALYPSMQEQPQQQPSAAPPRSEQEIADLFYGDAAFRDVKLNDEEAHLDKPHEVVSESNERWRDSLRAMELSEPESRELTQLVQQHTATPPSAEQQVQWQREVGERLVMQYGEEGARHRLELVRKLAARDPVMVKTLSRAGLLNNPRIVDVAIARAWSAAARGDL